MSVDERSVIEEEKEARERAKKGLERKSEFKTLSGITVKRIYTPEDVKNLSYEEFLGEPGQYPFTRGVYPTMYRGRLWTIRMFSGYGGAEETNRRWKELIKHGETGLSTAFDFPTIEGYDSDDPKAEGEVGRCGVAVSCLPDMEVLFNGIPIDKVTTSFTINAPAICILSMYFALAEKHGIPLTRVGGTTQNDMLKEFIAQKSYRFPPEPSLWLNCEIIRFCAEKAPLWHPVSISGYHIREAGATAVQELAWTLADGITYVEKTIDYFGLDVDSFAPRLSFFFCCHIDFFEEIAKFRAARRMWAKIMRERFGAKNPRSMMLRFHTQTAGQSLTYQYPELNIARTAIEALAAVLGGTQSLHTNSYDEAVCLPTDEAAKIATLTQRVIAHETGVCNTVDPLGGSYFVEKLTSEIEALAWEEIERIEKQGGVLKCIENGYYLREIAKSANDYRRKLEAGEIEVVGVNCFQPEELKYDFQPLKVPLDLEKRRREFLAKVRSSRNNLKVKDILNRLRKAAEDRGEVFPIVMEAVKAHATLGEIMQTFEDVFGRYKEQPIF